MEAKDAYNISSIETKLDSLLRGTVSDNVFICSIPSQLQSDWEDMVLIDLGTEIEDKDAYADGLVDIALYARPIGDDNEKNVAVLDQLEKALNAVVNASAGADFQMSRARAHSDFDTNIFWHCNVVTLNLRVY